MEEESFKFTESNLKEAYECMSRYPKGRQASAVMALLYIVQRQSGGYIPSSAVSYIANLLSMHSVHVREVVEFYSMYNTVPVGKYLVQICKTTPCWLRGSDDILNRCKKSMGINTGETTSDRMFTLREVECLGACVNAPVVQINDDYYENLKGDLIEEILDKLRNDSKNNGY